jgi:phosphotransacetylase
MSFKDVLAEIAISAAKAAHKLGFTPRVAFLSYSTFGNPPGERMAKVRDAVALLDAKGDVGFEYDGEMAVDVALNPEARRLYPFCRLTGAANVLVMPAIHSAAISTKIAATLGGVTVLGPLLPVLVGLGLLIAITLRWRSAKDAAPVEDEARSAEDDERLARLRARVSRNDD